MGIDSVRRLCNYAAVFLLAVAGTVFALAGLGKDNLPYDLKAKQLVLWGVWIAVAGVAAGLAGLVLKAIQVWREERDNEDNIRRKWAQSFLGFRNATAAMMKGIDKSYEVYRWYSNLAPDWRTYAREAAWPLVSSDPVADGVPQLTSSGQSAATRNLYAFVSGALVKTVAVQRQAHDAKGNTFLENTTFAPPPGLDDYRRNSIQLFNDLARLQKREPKLAQQILDENEVGGFRDVMALLGYLTIATAADQNSSQRGDADRGFWDLGERLSTSQPTVAISSPPKALPNLQSRSPSVPT